MPRVDQGEHSDRGCRGISSRRRRSSPAILADHLGLRYELYHLENGAEVIGVPLRRLWSATPVSSVCFYDKRLRVALKKQGKTLTPVARATVEDNVLLVLRKRDARAFERARDEVVLPAAEARPLRMPARVVAAALSSAAPAKTNRKRPGSLVRTGGLFRRRGATMEIRRSFGEAPRAITSDS